MRKDLEWLRQYYDRKNIVEIFLQENLCLRLRPQAK
ncbi:hypothetical protein IMSAGC009_04513 [Lachnospiraceae bacterium]|nr:hypothetical protein IMSAGC009_04513 [Lachnospiraceae bacterium]